MDEGRVETIQRNNEKAAREKSQAKVTGDKKDWYKGTNAQQKLCVIAGFGAKF